MSMNGKTVRLMKNLRTGKLAVYDADLVQTGKWTEFFPEPPKPKGIALKGVRITGSLEVSNGDSAKHHQ